MIVRKLRLRRGWSQETLAEVSGLNVRTIQRIERGERAGLETLNALAAVLEVPITDIQEPDMSESETRSNKETDDESEAIRYVRDLKAFYQHLGCYLLVMAILVFLNLMTSPDHIWFLWPMFGWGIGVAIHGLSVHELFNFIGPEWERRQIEKRTGRRL